MSLLSASREQVAIVLLGTLLCLCSSGPFYVVPAYLDAINTRFGIAPSQLGTIAGLESFAIAISCTATGLLLRHLGWRTMLASAAFCLVGNLLTMKATRFPEILGIRTLVGLLGEGPLYAMGYAVLGSAANPDRAFGVAITVVATFASVILGWPDQLLAVAGPSGVLVPYSAIALLLAVMAWTRRPSLGGDIAATVVTGSQYQTIAIIVSILLWSSAAGAFWAFTGVAATSVGVSPATITRALSIGLLLGLAGAILPAVIGDRFGRALPMTLATAGLILSGWIFFAFSDLPLLATALTLLQFCWDMSIVYQLASLAAIDPSGRSSAIGAVAQIIGIAIGPAAVGHLLGSSSYRALLPAVTVLSLAALAFFIFAMGHARSLRSRSICPPLG